MVVVFPVPGSPYNKIPNLLGNPYSSNNFPSSLKFRNILRANTKIANQYTELKKELAMRYKEDREAYTERKTDFIQNTLKQYRRL